VGVAFDQQQRVLAHGALNERDQADRTNSIFPEEALADIRTSARFALESRDFAIVKRDLEMILTTVDASNRTPSE